MKRRKPASIKRRRAGPTPGKSTSLAGSLRYSFSSLIVPSRSRKTARFISRNRDRRDACPKLAAGSLGGGAKGCQGKLARRSCRRGHMNLARRFLLPLLPPREERAGERRAVLLEGTRLGQQFDAALP